MRMKGADAYLVLSSVVLILPQCPCTPASTSGFVHCFFIKRDTSSPVGMCIPPSSCVPSIMTRRLGLCRLLSPVLTCTSAPWSLRLMSGLSSQQPPVPNLQPRTHPFLERAFIWGAHGLTFHRVGTAPQTLSRCQDVAGSLASFWGHGSLCVQLIDWMNGRV